VLTDGEDTHSKLSIAVNAIVVVSNLLSFLGSAENNSRLWSNSSGNLVLPCFCLFICFAHLRWHFVLRFLLGLGTPAICWNGLRRLFRVSMLRVLCVCYVCVLRVCAMCMSVEMSLRALMAVSQRWSRMRETTEMPWIAPWEGHPLSCLFVCFLLYHFLGIRVREADWVMFWLYMFPFFKANAKGSFKKNLLLGSRRGSPSTNGPYVLFFFF